MAENNSNVKVYVTDEISYFFGWHVLEISLSSTFNEVKLSESTGANDF